MDLHKLASKDSREILTSTAWNALIHHPVGEVEEQVEDLPSTVDMDAIKGAPTTPLTAPSTPWSMAENGNSKAIDSEESSSDDDDDDSEASSSGSDSDECGSDSCTYSTSSSSRSSSSSSRTGSRQSTPARQTFSVSKYDAEQGGLKLKISALKVNSSSKPASNRRADTDSDHSSTSASKGLFVEPKAPPAPKADIKPVEEGAPKKTDAKDVKKAAPKANPLTLAKQKKPEVKPPEPKPVPKKVAPKVAAHSSPSKVAVVKKVETVAKKVIKTPPKKKVTEASRLRSVRRKGVSSSNAVTANSSLRHGRAPASTSSRSDSTTPDSSESEEGEGSRDAVAEITQLAQQLGHIGAQEPAETAEPLPSMTEHLQVINQEDLAAILPDVVTTETTAGFDGFEDVSSESGKAEKKEATAQDSGSDVELPDQIVSDAIKRIHVDSEDVDNSDSDKDADKSTPPKLSAQKDLDSDSNSSDDYTETSPVYSSSLLQQFVEKTEILSAQCEKLISAGRDKKHAAIATISRVKKTIKRSQRAAKAKAAEVAKAMPELESYRLDCSTSNVSPDSGVHSVPGSPINEISSQDPTPPILRPVSPPENGMKKRRGRPKKCSDTKEVSKEAPKLETHISPSLSKLLPSRRGPGRPKKLPPVLEPNSPVSQKTSPSNLNLMLNEICDRVNRRLDVPNVKPSRGIELKELERIINDHKSTKARNSKIDAIFSKSKKLSNIPNIAIVKPMQHHILNERNDDDEKQNKKGGKRNKEKLDEFLAGKMDLKPMTSPEKDEIGREIKSEKERKSQKSAFTSLSRIVRPARARTRHTSSGTDVSCDKSVDSDIKKSSTKTEKSANTKEGKRSANVISDTNSNTSKTSSVVSYVKPIQRKPTHKNRARYLGLRQSLSHHKHKRKGSKKLKKREKENRALFFSELEKIIVELQKVSIGGRKALPTAPVPPTPASTPAPVAQVSKAVPVAVEPRLKRSAKKRKGSEKSKGSDKDERTKLSDRESSAEDPTKERDKEKPKRKQKKGQEVVKDTSEASPNEQRLPLKKRHYHLTPTNQNIVETASETKGSPNDESQERIVKENPVRKEADRAKDGQSRVLRSSVDDTIEATINRFSENAMESGQRTVIVTPKKRHRVEEENTEDKAKSKDKPGVGVGQAKPSGGKVTPNTRPVSHPVADKGGGKSTVPGREGVIKTVGVIEPKKRIGSRSSSLNKDLSDAALNDKIDRTKRVVSKVDKKSQMVEKRHTRSATKPLEVDEKLGPLQLELFPAVVTDSSKESFPVADVNKTKLPTAGIFEPSIEEVEIDSSILVPLNSPSELKNDLKGSLSVKKIKPSSKKSAPLRLKSTNITVDEKPPTLPVVPSEDTLLATCPVISKPPTLTTAQFLLRTAEMKKKARRRKFINRTGFPTMKKRKKKLGLLTECKTVDGSVISPPIESADTPPMEIGAPKPVENISQPIKVENLKKELPESLSAEASDDDVPLKQVLLEKSVPKISHRLEEKLNAGRLPMKRSKKSSSEIAKKRKVEKSTQKPPEIEESLVEDKTVVVSQNVGVVAAPIRKRKRSSTIKNTKSKLKTRYNLPLVSMKKFKKAKMEEKPASEDESEPAETKKKSQPRWKKRYLTAGMFAEYYKDDNCLKPSKVVEKPLSKWTFNPEDYPNGLLPPPVYCEKFVRRRRLDFKLPYDLWWQHANNQLPGRGVVPSWNYRKIRTNVYYDVKPQTTGGNEAQACSCKLPTSKQQPGCGDDCFNRMVFCECIPSQCPCGDRCSNQRIQRHEYAPGLERFMTNNKGWGVRTNNPIKSGDFILEYVGEVVSEKEFKERMQSRYVNDTHHYCLHLDGGLVIDGHRMGGDGRFVNHSCEPNCEMQKWTVNGLFRMALFALRSIPAGSELSYDYNFSLFDPAEGQVCLCGAKTCRGVIGGKSQRVTVPGGAVQTSRPGLREKKTGRGRKSTQAKRRNDKGKTYLETTAVKASTKPMSHQQRCFAKLHRCFLLRNVEKVRRGRDCPRSSGGFGSDAKRLGSEVKPADVFYTQLNALSTLRSIKTRRLAQAEDNPELAKTAKLAHVFKLLYNAVVTAKDEKGELLASPFTCLPSKKKQPQYYVKVADPTDLTTIEQNINSGKYETIEAFDADVNRLFANNVKYYGRTTELGIAATRLKRSYNIAKLDVALQLEQILGDSLPASFLPEKTDPGAEEEDVIRCICGMYKDEGVMIQCERCMVWQHCDCVKADDSCEHYLCERCQPRKVNYEILMEPPPEYAQEGQTHYMTLMRGTLQLRLGDTVYVLRDMNEESVTGSSPPRKVTYRTAKNVNYADLDIFRVERLWIDDKGCKFAFGHHYLRPHETYHEPSRKFFVNEVMRVPLYEVVPFDLIYQHCWVLDLGTFCKGRPVEAPEEHVYICEYRVDKSARLFAKIAKPYPICTKNYAFEKFEARLRPVRTYTPHGSVPSRRRARSTTHGGDEPRRADSDEELPLARVRDYAHAAKRDMQKKRLNQILVNMLNRLPKQQPLDLTYLLEPVKRARSKSNAKKPEAGKN